MEVIFLDCGAGGPQLKRNPLGSHNFMLRWLESLEQWSGRVYSLVFLALAGLFFYWSARGLLAYKNGVRAAWSEPVACVVGLIAGGLSLWVGTRLMQKGMPRGGLVGGKGISEDLEATLEAADRLQDSDPVAARQLLDSYFMREAAAKEARRADLRQRAFYDRDAAIDLRRELKDDLATNALMRQDLVKDLPANERVSMLAELDATDRDLRSELIRLEEVIKRLIVP
jgi:hypothetical protein